MRYRSAPSSGRVVSLQTSRCKSGAGTAAGGRHQAGRCAHGRGAWLVAPSMRVAARRRGSSGPVPRLAARR